MSMSHLATYLMLATINFGFVAWIAQRSNRSNAKKIYAIEVGDAQLQREKSNSRVTTPVHALLLALFVESGLMQVTTQDGFAIFVFTFLATFIWTEIWHYFSHRALHWQKLHFIHKEHHLSRTTNAWTSLSFSFLEKFIFSTGIIGVIAIISWLHPVSFYGVAAYYVLYFFTNTLGHANIEIRSENYAQSFMSKLFNTPSYHALHHARYTKNYGLITPFLDRLFDTAWKDSGQVQRRAAQGKPLTSLSEKT
jgi:Delta7-sterol 5-desaturase